MRLVALAAGRGDNFDDSVLGGLDGGLRSDDDNGVVALSNCDLGVGFVPQALNGGALSSDDTGEGRTIGKGKESDVASSRSTVDGLLEEGLRTGKRFVGFAPERPFNVAFLRSDVIGSCDPFDILREGIFLVDPGSGTVSSRTRWVNLCGHTTEVDENVDGAQGAIEVTTLKDGVVVFGRNGHSLAHVGLRGGPFGSWLRCVRSLGRQLGDGGLATSGRSDDLDQVLGRDALNFVSVVQLASAGVCPRAGEPDLCTGPILKVGEMLATASDEGSMQSSWDVDSESDTIALSSSKLL